MYEEIKEKYNFSSWGIRSGTGMSLLLRQFSPWEEDCLGWNRTTKESFADVDGRRLIRSVLGNPEDRDARLLVDVYESPTLTEAREYLIQLLASNQLKRLPGGPDDLGEVSFMHPEGIPPAHFWLRGNLCIRVCSFGKREVAVLDCAYKVDRRIMEKPKVDRFTLTLTPPPQKDRLSVEEEVRIDFSLPWQLGTDGYYKFFAAGGELFFRGQELHFRAQEKGEVLIEAFAVEPRREPYGGRLTLQVSNPP